MSTWHILTIERLVEFHTRAIRARWPRTPIMTKALLFGFIVLTSLAILMNLQVRSSQYDAWSTLQTSSKTFEFSTTDAPHFLNLAGALKRGESVIGYEALLAYPDNLLAAKKTSTSVTDKSPPLLSVLLSQMARSDDPADLIAAGHKLVVICSGLTVALIIFAFATTGYWLEGIIAAAGSGLSAAYLVRTSAGRIDTDMLNLGLLYATFGTVLVAGQVKSTRNFLFCCVLSGFTARLFLNWYDRSILLWLALAALIWLTLASRRQLLPSACGILIFVGLSGVDFLNSYIYGYFTDTIRAATFTFPNTLASITENTTLSFSKAITQATGSIEMGIVCLAGLTLWAIRHPILAVGMSPLLALGMLNFIVGNRFIFYSTPMLWFGFGYLLTLTTSYIQSAITSEGGSSISTAQTVRAFSALLGLIIVWVNSPTKYIPKMTFSDQMLAGFASLDGQFDPTNTVVASWWDYGYTSTFLNNLPVLHYGGSVNTAATHIVASALLKDDQHKTVGMLKFLSVKGSQGVNALPGAAALDQAFSDAHEITSPDVLLIVTHQMSGWMGSISKIANWDIEKGRPILLPKNPDGSEVGYRRLNCRFNGYPKNLACNGKDIDLENGLIDGAPLLVGWAHAVDGKILRSRKFSQDAHYGFQIIQHDGRVTAYLVHRQLYNSTFNKLYHFGHVNHPTISIHYDDYPHIRVYKIKGDPISNAAHS